MARKKLHLADSWYVSEEQPKRAHSIKPERIEVLWTNYDVGLEIENNRSLLFEKAEKTET